MKYVWLSIFCVLSEICFAQIKVESLPFEVKLADALRRASKEKKLVFMDCHTPWCDGCRLMEKNVFTDESVIRFFQTNFINVSVDMAKGEGKELAEKYNVCSFPALLFLDVKGNIRHLMIGYCPPEEFIAEGQKAMDSRENLEGMTKRFKKGERTSKFLADYLTILRKANKKEFRDVALLYVDKTGLRQRFKAGEREPHFMEEYAKVLDIAKVDEYLREFVPEYLSVLPVKQMATGRNWLWLRFYCSLRFTDAVRKVADWPNLFVEVAGGIDHVNQIIDQALRQETFHYLRWFYDPEFVWNDSEFEAFLQYLYSIDSPVASECFIRLTGLKCVIQKDYEGLLKNMRRILEYNVLPISFDGSYFHDLLIALRNCPDGKCVNEGIRLINQCIIDKVSEEQKERWQILKQQLIKYIEKLESK